MSYSNMSLPLNPVFFTGCDFSFERTIQTKNVPGISECSPSPLLGTYNRNKKIVSKRARATHIDFIYFYLMIIKL